MERLLYEALRIECDAQESLTIIHQSITQYQRVGMQYVDIVTQFLCEKKMTKKTDEDKRLRDIQNHLVKHIEKEIQDEDDFMYMATMLLKHSMVLYKTFLSDDEIRRMLRHVGKTISSDTHDITKYMEKDKTPPTMH